MPKTHRSREPRVQGGVQPQVSVQRPLTQTDPVAQVTPAQGLASQRPSTQYCESVHTTPSQGECGAQAM